MANSIMAEVAKLIGLELGEVFEIKGEYGRKFKLDDTYGLVSVTENGEEKIAEDNSRLFEGLVTGIAKITPWKPRNGDTYFFFGIDGELAYDTFRTVSALHLYRFASGNCFETAVEASKSVDEVRAKINEVKKRLHIGGKDDKE